MRNLYISKNHENDYPKVQYYSFGTSNSNVMAIQMEFDVLSQGKTF